ncbi:MAG: ABC transporter substrate-binding protein [Desulfotignum sp.]|jgi:NitT/TauT family transport system substrate-binding protein|nr:ABC transporter substrate-binding protein [Desulfotignum sp.]
MENHFPDICIGHLKIVDHLVLGMAAADHPGVDEHRPWRLVPVPMNTWDEICDKLGNETIQGAFIPTPLALELFASGMDIRFLMFVHRSGSLLVKNRKAGIHSLADFNGKPVLVPSWFSIQAMLLHKLLGASGLVLGPHDQPGSDVFLETAPPYLMPKILLAENDMDEDDPATGGFMAPEPFGSLAVTRGQADIVCTSDSLWKNHPCCGFVVTRHFLKTYPRIPKALVSLFFAAARHLEKKTILDQAALGAGFLAQDPVLVQAALARSRIGFTPERLVPDTDAIDRIQTYMVDAMGIMPKKIDQDIFVDKSWAENALSEVCIAD